jgi:hypothetical protein
LKVPESEQIGQAKFTVVKPRVCSQEVGYIEVTVIQTSIVAV